MTRESSAVTVCDPTLDVETALFDTGARFVIGCDEVGRGAVAGPVAVGMAVLSRECVAIPAGLRDSKLLSQKRREELAPLVSAWVLHSAVGFAGPDEVDGVGIIAALGLAGRRALRMLHEQGVEIAASVLLLDGNHDYLSPVLRHALDIRTRVKGDRDCASISAASVIAKVRRDGLMIAEHERYPHYGWSGNKGYGSVQHMTAIRKFGVSGFHRRTWLTEHVG